MSIDTTLILDEQIAREVLRWNDATCEAVIGVSGRLPGFSSHIEAAWEVVDEMEERGYDWEIWRGFSTRPGALFSREDGPHHPTKAATVTEAICLAALAAVRGEKERQT